MIQFTNLFDRYRRQLRILHSDRISILRAPTNILFPIIHEINPDDKASFG